MGTVNFNLLWRGLVFWYKIWGGSLDFATRRACYFLLGFARYPKTACILKSSFSPVHTIVSWWCKPVLSHLSSALYILVLQGNWSFLSLNFLLAFLWIFWHHVCMYLIERLGAHRCWLKIVCLDVACFEIECLEVRSSNVKDNQNCLYNSKF